MARKTVAWESTKIKPKRGRSIAALVSDAAPGIALQVGEWIDMKSSKGKEQLDTKSGYRAIVASTGVIVGPVLSELDKASDYAVALSQITDWSAATSATVPGPVYAKVMRLWYPAAGEKLTAAMRKQLDKLEAESPAPPAEGGE